MSDDPKLHLARVKHFGRKLKAKPQVAPPATPKQATHPTAPKAVADPVQKKLATVAGIASSRHTQSGDHSGNRKTTYARHANLHVCASDEAQPQLAMPKANGRIWKTRQICRISGDEAATRSEPPHSAGPSSPSTPAGGANPLMRYRLPTN